MTTLLGILFHDPKMREVLTKQRHVIYSYLEPMATDEPEFNDSGLPVSVWSAIQVWRDDNPELWSRMAKKCFNLSAKDSKILMREGVLARIVETNHFERKGVASYSYEVWIDAEGEFRMQVYPELLVG